jgi:hypothetical protein
MATRVLQAHLGRRLAGFLGHIVPTIIGREFIARSTRMPHFPARLSTSASSHHDLSLAGFITNIAESDFRYTQVSASYIAGNSSHGFPCFFPETGKRTSETGVTRCWSVGARGAGQSGVPGVKADFCGPLDWQIGRLFPAPRLLVEGGPLLKRQRVGGLGVNLAVAGPHQLAEIVLRHRDRRILRRLARRHALIDALDCRIGIGIGEEH